MADRSRPPPRRRRRRSSGSSIPGGGGTSLVLHESDSPQKKKSSKKRHRGHATFSSRSPRALFSSYRPPHPAHPRTPWRHGSGDGGKKKGKGGGGGGEYGGSRRYASRIGGYPVQSKGKQVVGHFFLPSLAENQRIPRFQYVLVENRPTVLGVSPYFGNHRVPGTLLGITPSDGSPATAMWQGDARGLSHSTTSGGSAGGGNRRPRSSYYPHGVRSPDDDDASRGIREEGGGGEVSQWWSSLESPWIHAYGMSSREAALSAIEKPYLRKINFVPVGYVELSVNPLPPQWSSSGLPEDGRKTSPLRWRRLMKRWGATRGGSGGGTASFHETAASDWNLPFSPPPSFSLSSTSPFFPAVRSQGTMTTTGGGPLVSTLRAPASFLAWEATQEKEEGGGGGFAHDAGRLLPPHIMRSASSSSSFCSGRCRPLPPPRLQAMERQANAGSLRSLVYSIATSADPPSFSFPPSLSLPQSSSSTPLGSLSHPVKATRPYRHSGTSAERAGGGHHTNEEVEKPQDEEENEKEKEDEEDVEEEEEEERALYASGYYRLQRYYYYRKRCDLATVAMYYSKIDSVARHLSALVPTFGPEPGRFTVTVNLREVFLPYHTDARVAWRDSEEENDHADEEAEEEEEEEERGGGKTKRCGSSSSGHHGDHHSACRRRPPPRQRRAHHREVFVLARCGLEEYASPALFSSVSFRFGKGCCFEFELGVLDGNESIDLIVMECFRPREAKASSTLPSPPASRARPPHAASSLPPRRCSSSPAFSTVRTGEKRGEGIIAAKRRGRPRLERRPSGKDPGEAAEETSSPSLSSPLRSPMEKDTVEFPPPPPRSTSAATQKGHRTRRTPPPSPRPVSRRPSSAEGHPHLLDVGWGGSSGSASFPYPKDGEETVTFHSLPAHTPPPPPPPLSSASSLFVPLHASETHVPHDAPPPHPHDHRRSSGGGGVTTHPLRRTTTTTTITPHQSTTPLKRGGGGGGRHAEAEEEDVALMELGRIRLVVEESMKKPPPPSSPSSSSSPHTPLSFRQPLLFLFDKGASLEGCVDVELFFGKASDAKWDTEKEWSQKRKRGGGGGGGMRRRRPQGIEGEANDEDTDDPSFSSFAVSLGSLSPRSWVRRTSFCPPLMEEACASPYRFQPPGPAGVGAGGHHHPSLPTTTTIPPSASPSSPRRPHPPPPPPLSSTERPLGGATFLLSTHPSRMVPPPSSSSTIACEAVGRRRSGGGGGRRPPTSNGGGGGPMREEDTWREEHPQTPLFTCSSSSPTSSRSSPSGRLPWPSSSPTQSSRSVGCRPPHSPLPLSSSWVPDTTHPTPPPLPSFSSSSPSLAATSSKRGKGKPCRQEGSFASSSCRGSGDRVSSKEVGRREEEEEMHSFGTTTMATTMEMAPSLSSSSSAGAGFRKSHGRLLSLLGDSGGVRPAPLPPRGEGVYVHLTRITGLRLHSSHFFRSSILITQSRKVLLRTADMKVHHASPRGMRAFASASSSPPIPASALNPSGGLDAMSSFDGTQDSHAPKKNVPSPSSTLIASSFFIPMRASRSLDVWTFTFVISISHRGIGFEDYAWCEFCLDRHLLLRHGTTTSRRLRLYSRQTHQLVGIAHLHIRHHTPFSAPSLVSSPRTMQVPSTTSSFPSPLPPPSLLLTSSSWIPEDDEAEKVKDELALLLSIYRPSLLHQLDVLVHRSRNVKALPYMLQRRLVPQACGTAFFGVQAVVLKADVMDRWKPLHSGGWAEKLQARHHPPPFPSSSSTSGHTVGGASWSHAEKESHRQRAYDIFARLSRNTSGGLRDPHAADGRRGPTPTPSRTSPSTTTGGNGEAEEEEEEEEVGRFPFSRSPVQISTTTTTTTNSFSLSASSPFAWRHPEALPSPLFPFPGMILVADGSRASTALECSRRRHRRLFSHRRASASGSGGSFRSSGSSVRSSRSSATCGGGLTASPTALSPRGPRSDRPPPPLPPRVTASMDLRSPIHPQQQEEEEDGGGWSAESTQKSDFLLSHSSLPPSPTTATPSRVSNGARAPHRAAEDVGEECPLRYSGSHSGLRSSGSSGWSSSQGSSSAFFSFSSRPSRTPPPALGTHEGKKMDPMARRMKGASTKNGSRRGGGGRRCRSSPAAGGGLERGEALLESFARELYITVERKTIGGSEDKEEERGGGKGRKPLRKNDANARRHMFYNGAGPTVRKRAWMDGGGGGGGGGMTDDTRALRLERELGLAFDLTRVDVPSSCPSFSVAEEDGGGGTSVASPFPTYGDPIVVRLWHSRRPYSRHHKAKEIGRAIFSIRALLSERLYPRCASVTLPLVSVTERSNRAGVAFVGYIQLVVAPSTFLPLPPSIPLRTPSLISESFLRFCRGGGWGNWKDRRGGGGNIYPPDRRLMRTLATGENGAKTMAEEKEEEEGTTKNSQKKWRPPSFVPLHLQNMSIQGEASSGVHGRQIGDEAQWYFDLLWQFGEDYDPGLLLDLHYLVFEVFLQQPGWPRNAEKYLYQLARPWGE